MRDREDAASLEHALAALISVSAFLLPVPDAAPRRLEVFDLSGRRLFSRDVGTLGPGNHVVNVEGVTVTPGVYLARLSGAGEYVSTRSVVVRSGGRQAGPDPSGSGRVGARL